MGDERNQLERLLPDGTNWVSYRDRFMWVIEGHDWQDHLTHDTITQAYIDLGPVNNVQPPRRWMLDDRAVKTLISSSVPNPVFSQIKSHTAAKDVWNALKTLFEGRSALCLVDLGQRFQSTRCSETENIREHFNRLADLRDQLTSMGKVVTDAEYAAVLMGSLPPSYAGTLGSIAAAAELSQTAATSSIVIKLATDEYDRRTISRANEEALLAQTQGKDSKGRKPKRDVECTNCHRKGHLQAECWSKGGGNEGGGPKRKKRGGKGKEKSDSKGKQAESATAKDKSSDIEAWAAIEEVPDAEAVVPAMAVQDGGGMQSELYDSGASKHMSPYRKQFTTYRPINARPITAANNQVFHAVGMGDLEIRVPNGAESSKILLHDVLHVPDLSLTVVSISCIMKAGYSVQFDQGSCSITKKSDGKKIGCIPGGANGLFRVEHVFAAVTPDESVDILTLHRRLGHSSPDAIRALFKAKAITGIQLHDDLPPFSCDSCEYAKMTRKAIRKEREAPPAQAFAEEIHTDVWGPSPTDSLGGRRYYVTFTDDYSRYTVVNILRTKDQAFDSYKAFSAWAKTQHGAQVKRLRSDRGGEFMSNAFTAYLGQQGTERRLTTADTPQHNGIAEALNRRLLERVRAMLHQAELPKYLWAEAIRHAVWLKNRTSTKAIGKTTPYERLYKKKPILSNLPEWGQSVWVYEPSGSKLDARASQARWVGYDADSTHAHRIYWPGKNVVSVERNVKFVPTSVITRSPPPSYTTATAPAAQQPPAAPQPPPAPPFAPPAPFIPPAPYAPYPPLPPSPPAPPAAFMPPAQPVFRAPSPIITALPPHIPGEFPEPVAPPSTPTTLTYEEEDEVEETITPRRVGAIAGPSGQQQQPATAAQPLRRSGRLRQPSGYQRRLAAGEGTTGEEIVDYAYLAGFDDMIAAAIVDADNDPKTLAEARSRPDWPRWKEAMDREIVTLEKAGTWDTVPRPAGKNIVGSKWVFWVKRKADGSLDKYKARLVARGFTQIFGVDYFTTYSPVAKLTSFRAILAIAARHDWDIESFDFNGAYLNGELDPNEEIYMQSPPGYESDARAVKHLKKSLYGLKQAGRRWYDTLVRALTDLGFKISVADPGVFLARVGQELLVLAVHVDDCILMGSLSNLIVQYKARLNSCYALTDLGPVHWLLGIKITRDRKARTISLSQASYIDAILARFALSDAKPHDVPMKPKIIYSKKSAPTTPEEHLRMKNTPYREAVGSLMYAAVATRPDIAFAVSTLSQFLDNPGDLHWQAVKNVFRYLAGTKDSELTYGGERHDIEGYSDADGATQEHRHAISGYTFIFDGGAISWSSKKQELITLSTAEAEYVAATHAAKEAIWLRKLFGEIYPNSLSPTFLYCDNQSALKLATADNYHARTKHIDVRYHFIREVVARGAIKLAYCQTEDMVADMLTKALPKYKAVAHCASLGMRRACGGVM